MTGRSWATRREPPWRRPFLCVFLQGSSPITLLLAPLGTYLILSIVSLRDKRVSHTSGGWTWKGTIKCVGVAWEAAATLLHDECVQGSPVRQAGLHWAPGLSESALAAEGELGGGGEGGSRHACSTAEPPCPPPTQTQPLLDEAELSGLVGAASGLLDVDDQHGSRMPPLNLGLTSLSSSPEVDLIR